MERVVTIILVAGCFGGGSDPKPPGDATVAFSIADTGNCTTTGYLGDVSIQGNTGLVVVSPNANICNNNGGGNGQTLPTEFVQFDVGGSATTINTQSAGGLARLAWAGTTPFMSWLTNNNTGPSFVQAQFGTDAPEPLTLPSGGGQLTPADIVADGNGIWVAIGQVSTPQFDDTDFVNSGESAFNGNSNNNGNGDAYGFALFNLEGSAAQAFNTTEQWFSNSMPDCLAQNTNDVYGMARGSNGNGGNGLAYEIVQFPKATGSSDADFTVFAPSQQNNIGAQNVGPTGLAANDDFVVWTLAADLEDGQPACAVFASAVPGEGSQSQGGTPMTLLSTSSFSCAGAAVDGSAAYVAITKPDQDNNNGGGTALSGLGIARLGFDGSYASIATDITGAAYDGPRRVYVLPGPPEQIVAVDPHAIGIIPASAFDGRQDIHE